jgi:16S rRNA (uracil1498-N3)-methyltransferase
MTRRRFYAPPAAFSSERLTVTLGAEETRHARDVLRLQQGDEVYVFDGEGKEFRCSVHDFARDGAILDSSQEVEPARADSPLKLTLALALLKGEKFDLVVQKATELGVSRLVPIETTRADVRFRNSEDAKRKVTRWQRIALEAAKQCGRARLMQIDEPGAFETLITRAEHVRELRLVFAEREGASFAEMTTEGQSGPTGIVALVGSEGGWTDDEIARTRAAGWTIVTLGGRTLRAETAAIVAATLLQHRFGDLV